MDRETFFRNDGKIKLILLESSLTFNASCDADVM